MPPKLKVRPPKDDEGGVPPGVPPPNDGGASGSASGGASGGANLAASAPKQPSIYLDSLSALEQHVCRIAESHLESSFDLSRSTGYIAWKAKNGI